MDRLCDNLQKVIAEKTHDAGQMTLALYWDNERDLSCMFFVTRNMLDPPWHLTFVQRQYKLDWKAPVLLRGKMAFEFLFQTVLDDFAKNFVNNECDRNPMGAYVPSFMWVYTQGSSAPPKMVAHGAERAALFDATNKYITVEDNFGDEEQVIEDFEKAKSKVSKLFTDAVEALVATA